MPEDLKGFKCMALHQHLPGILVGKVNDLSTSYKPQEQPQGSFWHDLITKTVDNLDLITKTVDDLDLITKTVGDLDLITKTVGNLDLITIILTKSVIH